MAQSYIPMRTAFGAGRFFGASTRPLRFALECASVIAAVVVLALAAHVASWVTPISAVLYLFLVASIALFCGFVQAAVSSVAAVAAQACLDASRLHPAWQTLLAHGLLLLLLVAVSFAVSQSAGQARSHTRTAELWRGQMEDLCEFARRTLQMNLHVEPGQELTELVREVFALEAVAVFDADLHEVYQAGYWSADPREMAQNVYYFESSDDDSTTGIGRRVVRLGTVPVGSLVVRGETSPITNNAIASLIAITFDRYRAFANENRIEMERRAEQLRATVLDSLAHAYKTPLTAIHVAGTGLIEMGKLSPGQAELVALINEQTAALSELTTRLLMTARLDAGEVAIHAEPVTVAPIIEEVLAGLKDRLASMKVSVVLEEENLVLCCDRQLMITLLTQYIDNACKYSIFGTTITVRVARTATEAIFSVHSFGPVIPMEDRERIFDRYYRSSNYSNRAPGTGIGLSVAKRVAQIHGGYVWVTSDEHEGTTFFAAIPTITGKENPQ